MAEENVIVTVEVGLLKGHSNWVTAIEAGHPVKENQDTPVLISGSRDHTILIWKINNQSLDARSFAQPLRCLTGHSHFISDLALTSDNNFLLSSSWDKTMRLWDLKNAKTTQRFVEDGHTKEILSCAISSDSRFILSSGADNEIKLWNIKGECKHTVKEHSHSEWVSKVRFIPSSSKAAGLFFASVGWDGYLKIWNNQAFAIKDSFRAHDANLNALAVSPRGNFVVTGGKDKKVKVFDFTNVERDAPTHDAGAPVTCLAFNPKFHWIAIGTEVGWRIWDFELAHDGVIAEGDYKLEGKKLTEEKATVKSKPKPEKFHMVTSITWNPNGSRLFVGFSNGDIKAIDISEKAKQ